MWLQKRINKRFIKRAIWSDYIYQIEAEECRTFSNGFHNPCWKQYNYGYSEIGPMPAGFRLIRNIGNNAKWSEVKSDSQE